MICGDVHHEILPRAVRSVLDYHQPLVDEIVICWNGQGADARDIALSLDLRPINSTIDSPVSHAKGATSSGVPVNVYRQRWTGDFGAARTESFERVRSDWIFWLDADDVLTPTRTPGRGPLIQIPLGAYLNKIDSEIVQVWTPYRYKEDPEEWQLHPRLLRRDANWRSVGVAHEEFECDAADPTWAVLPGLQIWHMPTQSEHERQARNVAILDAAIGRGEATPLILYYKARSMEDAGDLQGALRVYHAALANALSERKWHRYVYQIAMMASPCALRAQDYKLSAKLSAVAVGGRPDLPEAHNAMGVALTLCGTFVDAATAFDVGRVRSVEILKGREALRFNEFPEFEETSPTVLACRGQAYMEVGRPGEALRTLRAIPPPERGPEVVDMIKTLHRTIEK